MKKTRKILAVALFLLLMLTPVVSVSQPVTVQAAAKTTLKKSGGRYYAYENGKNPAETIPCPSSRAARSAIPITLEQMVQPIRPTKK